MSSKEISEWYKDYEHRVSGLREWVSAVCFLLHSTMLVLARNLEPVFFTGS